jgi:hypothetical protein
MQDATPGLERLAHREHGIFGASPACEIEHGIFGAHFRSHQSSLWFALRATPATATAKREGWC